MTQAGFRVTGEAHEKEGQAVTRLSRTFLVGSLCLLSWATAWFGLSLSDLNRLAQKEIPSSEGVAFFTVLAVVYPAVGAFLAARRPQNLMGWIFLAAGLCVGLSFFAHEYATYSFLTRPSPLPMAGEMAWLAYWVWEVGFGLLLTFMLLLFPDGRLLSRRWRWVAGLAAGAIAWVAIPAAVVLWPLRGPALLGHPEQVAHSALLDLSVWGWPLLLLCSLASVISLMLRFRQARGDQRQQLKWFALAGALTLAVVVGREMIGLIRTEDEIREMVTDWVGLATIPLLPIAVGIAVFKYRLYDIDIIIRRTLLYSTLTGLLALIYFVSVVVLQGLFRAVTGQDSQAAVVASTLTAAALFVPLRRRMQDGMDRRFYRRKYDTAQTLAAFSAAVRDEVDLGKLGDDLAAVVQETMQPAHISVWLRTGRR